MFFSLVSALATLAIASAAPAQEARTIYPPVVATLGNAPISGYQLAIGANNTAVLEKQGLQVPIAYHAGGIQFNGNAGGKWLNLGPGSASSGSLPLVFGDEQVTTNWQAGSGQVIYNTQYHSSNFQVCEDNGTWVVRLVTPAASEPVDCYYTELMAYSD